MLLISSVAHADFLGFKTEDGINSRIPDLIEKIKNLKMTAGPAYEESFNQLVKNLEVTVDEEKLYCAGEATDSKGKVVPRDQKQLCFRELKANYLEAIEVIFNMKKKYLGIIHNSQIDTLSEIQTRLKSDIEKSF
jgi:hypothetical protein